MENEREEGRKKERRIELGLEKKMNQPPDWVGEEDDESAYRFVQEKMREEGRWGISAAHLEHL